MFRKHRSKVSNKEEYTQEQLRHMIAPPVLDPVARSFGGPNPSQNLAQRFREMESLAKRSEGVEPAAPQSVPLIGGSARSNAQIKAYREQPKER